MTISASSTESHPHHTHGSNAVYPTNSGVRRGPPSGSGPWRADSGVGNIFNALRRPPRDRSHRGDPYGRPHRFWLVVGAASGTFPGWASEISRDRVSNAFQNDGPRRFWLVVGAAIGNFHRTAGRDARDSGAGCQFIGRPHRFWLVVGAASGIFPGWASEISRDRVSNAFQNDGPRRFWLVVGAAIGNFHERGGSPLRRSLPSAGAAG